MKEALESLVIFIYWTSVALWTIAVYLLIWDVLGVLLSIVVWLMGTGLLFFTVAGLGILISKLSKRESPDER